jgi:transposase
MAVERMRTCESVTELARELGVRPRCLYKWRAKLDLVEPGEESARPSTHEGSYRKQVQQLKRLLGEKVMEVDFLKGALQKVEARRRTNNGSGETASTTKSED